MKLIFDQNISFRVVKSLLDIFPESVHVTNLSLSNASDQEIWNFAKRNECTIVTFFSDFYDFSLIWGYPPQIIWIRTGNKSSSEVVTLLKRHSNNIGSFIAEKELACLAIR